VIEFLHNGRVNSRKLEDMRPYRPNVQEQKRRYSLELALKRLRGKKTVRAKPLRSNSEPWIANPRTLEEAERISDAVARAASQWGIK
jgi:hypothetical protein